MRERKIVIEKESERERDRVCVCVFESSLLMCVSNVKSYVTSVS